MRRVLVGQEHLIERLLVALLADGHVLLEGAAGVGKRLTVQTLAHAIGADFERVVLTSDLGREDLLGACGNDGHEKSCERSRGPVFANVLLAEDVDHAPPKVRGALVQAMQERQIRIGQAVYPLADPFFVVGTRRAGAGEHGEGLQATHLDCFLLKVVVPAPSADEEREVIDVAAPGLRMPEIRPVATAAEIRRARRILAAIFMDGRIKDYIVNLVHATRRPVAYGLPPAEGVRFSASPRATLGLVAAAKARAFLDGRGHATPEDVQQMTMDVLRHRVRIAPESHEAECLTSEDFIQRILDVVPVP